MNHSQGSEFRPEPESDSSDVPGATDAFGFMPDSESSSSAANSRSGSSAVDDAAGESAGRSTKKKATRKKRAKKATRSSSAVRKTSKASKAKTAEADSESRADSDEPERPKARRSRRTSRSTESQDSSESRGTEDSAEESPKRRSLRGGSTRRPRKSASQASGSVSESGDEAVEPGFFDEDDAPRPARRRSRAKAGRSQAAASSEDADPPSRSKASRSRSRKKPAPEELGSEGSTEGAEESTGGLRRKRTRRSRSRSTEQSASAESRDDQDSSDGSAERPTRATGANRAKPVRKSTRAAESEADGEEPKRPRRSRSRSRSESKGDEERSDNRGRTRQSRDEQADASDVPSELRESGERTRRTRKKRPSKRSEAEATQGEERSDDRGDNSGTRLTERASSESGDGEKRGRRRGSRGGRRRNKSRNVEVEAVAVEAIPGEEDLPPDLSFDDYDEHGDKKSRKAKGKSKGKGKDKDKRSKAKRAEEDEDLDAVPEVKGPPNSILVNAAGPDEVRVAVVESEVITDFQMTVHNQTSLVNDIYRGKVVNLEPAIGAAFVDFGQGRNGFLHTSDVLSCYGDDDWELRKLLSTRVDVDEWSEEGGGIDDDSEDGDDEGSSKKKKGSKSKGRGKDKAKAKAKGRGRRTGARQRLPITDLLQKGESVVVQITKDAIGDKGPTLTTYISIPGRYLVLMPSVARTGVSRKIEDDKERRRLKRILKGMKIPEGMGVIVRTAGVGASKAELKRDLDYLLMIWDNFGRRLTLGRGPIALYEESDVAIRTMRDLFTPNTKEVVVDDDQVYDRMVEFTEKLMPDEVDRIQHHDGQRPLFHEHSIEQDFERIFSRRVELTSGGSIVFDQAEALVAIDVNSGKTRSDGFDFEDVALKTNLEAVPEIARQIRLRDLGGIVVVDFIDMMRPANRRAVEKAFRDAISGDRARSKIGRISQFGLLEMTRQRLGAGISKMLFANCSRCRGSGQIRTAESRAMAILRRLGSALTLKGFSRVELRAHPEVIEYLKEHMSSELSELQKLHDRQLTYTSVPDQVEDSVLRYLRADGREVRPGGRRKR